MKKNDYNLSGWSPIKNQKECIPTIQKDKPGLIRFLPCRPSSINDLQNPLQEKSMNEVNEKKVDQYTRTIKIKSNCKTNESREENKLNINKGFNCSSKSTSQQKVQKELYNFTKIFVDSTVRFNRQSCNQVPHLLFTKEVLDKQKSSLITDRPKYFSVTDRDTENLSVDELKKLMEFLQTESQLPLRYKEYLVPNDSERISFKSPKMVIGSNCLQQKLQKEINAIHKDGISHYKNFVIIKTKKGSFHNQNIQVTCPSTIETTKERESINYYNNQSLLSLNVRDSDKENILFSDKALVQNQIADRRSSSITRGIKPTKTNEINQQHLEQLIVSETRSCNYFVDQEMNYFNYLKLKRLKIEQQEKSFRNQYGRR